MSPENAWTATRQLFQLTEKEAREKLLLVDGKLVEP